MREASTIAMPAFASRPMVAEMCEHTAAAGLCPAALSLQTYDARTAAAWAVWLQSLPEAVHGPRPSTAALGELCSRMPGRRRDHWWPPGPGPGWQTHRRLAD